MRLIDADVLHDAILRDEKLDGKEVNWAVNRIINYILNAPTIEELPKGKWEIIYGEHIRAGLRPIMYACDVCGVVGSQTNFCPNCGADMRGDL